MKTIEELRQTDEKGLLAEIDTANRELFKHKFEVHNGESKNSHKIKEYRRYVAKIKTLQRERKMEKPKDSEKKLEKEA